MSIEAYSRTSPAVYEIHIFCIGGRIHQTDVRKGLSSLLAAPSCDSVHFFVSYWRIRLIARAHAPLTAVSYSYQENNFSYPENNLQNDYESAAVRHIRDATALQAIGRFDNAGHLVGFAAESAIKLRIQPSPADLPFRERRISFW
jgi:hypothetical protein